MRITAFTLFILITICAAAYAQRRFVVINMETKVPVRNVVVKYGKDTQSCTIWDGSFMLDSLLTDTCTQPLGFPDAHPHRLGAYRHHRDAAVVQCPDGGYHLR